MFFNLFWGDWTIIVMIPAMIFALVAQARVKSTFEKYNRVGTMRRISGTEAARRILDRNGLYHVRVERVSGHLTDHFDPGENVIRLSDATYGSVSVAALGVAAHEAGHAVQHATGYGPIKLRMAIIPVANLGSNLAMPLILIGLLMSIMGLAYVGIVFFALSTVV